MGDTSILIRDQSSGTVVKILSATYGPSEGKRLLTGELNHDKIAYIPFIRDVGPFLKAIVNKRFQCEVDDSDLKKNSSNLLLSSKGKDTSKDTVQIKVRKTFIPLMDGKQMNIIFGDPCPGTSKRLKIKCAIYKLLDGPAAKESSNSELQHVIFTTSFAEHERVVLHPTIPCFQDDTSLKNAIAAKIDAVNASNDNDCQHSEILRKAKRLGRTQSIAEFAETLQLCQDKITQQDLKPMLSWREKTKKKWRLRSAISEITLPIVLPFLKVKEKVQCKIVCKVWSHIISDLGVAQTIDVNDDAIFPNFTVNILRGLLAHSHHSLHSLFLGDFHELSKEILHPAIPFLRKLKCLDISRCNHLDDSTLLILSDHVSSTLEVFYLKGLRHVTDRGVVSISQSCSKLAVLELSHIPLTDESGISIGENLKSLKALYMRDNYLLTNKSIDIITKNCTQLTQLTLWGCTRLRHLSFQAAIQGSTCRSLILLNLWGCHSLVDEAAQALTPMHHLRSLVVSECHRLTNLFLFGLSQSVPQLNHLHLRYCKKITNEGINEITRSMQQLYSLDLSFCTGITHAGILNLLEIRQNSLTELRLLNCSHLDITRDLRHHNEFYGNFSGDGQAGRAILSVLRLAGKLSNLSVLDIRNCGGFQKGGYPEDDLFVKGFKSLGFNQIKPGFFRRRTRPNQPLYQHLIDDIFC